LVLLLRLALVVRELRLALLVHLLREQVVAAVETLMQPLILRLVALVALVAAAQVEILRWLVVLALSILVVEVAVVVQKVELAPQAVTAALALSSLKYLTTYPQHSLVALHRVCPHPVGSTSTL
jgi:hypothetical protein